MAASGRSIHRTTERKKYRLIYKRGLTCDYIYIQNKKVYRYIVNLYMFLGLGFFAFDPPKPPKPPKLSDLGVLPPNPDLSPTAENAINWLKMTQVNFKHFTVLAGKLDSTRR